MFQRPFLVLAAVLALLLGPSAGLLPAQELREKVAKFALDIAKVMKDDGNDAASVGDFTGPPMPTTSGGPAIQVILTEELKKQNVIIKEDAFIIIKGEYLVLEEEKKKKDDLTIQVIVTVRNKLARKIIELSSNIGMRGNEEMVKLLAINTDLTNYTKADPEAQNQKLKRDLDKPPVYLPPGKAEVKVNKANPFAVEVLIRPADYGTLKPRSATVTKGQAFVEIKRGEVYALRLHNNSKYEAAASIVIDGVDVLHFFEPAAGRPTTFLIGPGKTHDVEGWRRDSTRFNRFKVGAFADSAAARALKGSAKIGAITVCFHHCWEQGTKPPPEYDNARSATPDATGFGEEVKKNIKVLHRTIGPLVTAISIRYNK